LVQQLDADTAKIKTLVAEIQMGTYEVAEAVGTGSEKVVIEIQLVENTQQKLNQIADLGIQINTLLKKLAQAAAVQAQTSIAASQSVLEAASLTSRTSEQSLSVAESFSKLAATAQESKPLDTSSKIPTNNATEKKIAKFS